MITMDMIEAARRHYDDGQKLFEGRRFDNAGYHFGLSAECAVKQKLLDLGVEHRDDSLWDHWPNLKESAKLALSSRQAAKMRTLLSRGSYMQHWDIRIRYGKNGTVEEQRAARWREDANETLGLLI